MLAEELRRWTLVVSGLAIAPLGCSGGSGGAPDPAPPAVLTIESIEPSEGATEVEPDAAVRFELAANGIGLLAADVVVNDGGNVLPGTLSQSGTSTTWIWEPDEDFPRDCRIRVSVKGAPATTFWVRDGVVAGEFEVPGEVAEHVLCWPNGRSAVSMVSGRVFEVGETGLIERFVDVPSNAQTYGDGSFVGDDEVAGARFCVRGNLDGTWDRVQTPFDRPIGEINANGDVVMLVQSTSPWGLWRLLRSETSFSLVGSFEPAELVDTPSIQGDGTVSIAYGRPGIVQLSLFRDGLLPGEHHVLEGNVSQAHYDVDHDGRGVLAFERLEPSSQSPYGDWSVRAARFEPGIGLRELPEKIAGPTESDGVHAVHVGALGSACIWMSEFPSGNAGIYSVVRVEPDDRVGDIEVMVTIGGWANGQVRFSPRRASLWTAQGAINHLGLGRSRPDATSHTTWESGYFGSWDFAIDDSERAVWALVETVGPVDSTRILLWR